MASRANIEELRALARKRHRAATQKASRLRAKGVEVKGTKLDPRRNAADISKMRSRDLQSYISRLNSFNSRSTAYVQGATKTPLTGNKWQKYKALEKAVNQMNATPYDRIKDLFVSSLGMTVDQFQGMKPSHPITGNPASRAPHLPINKSSKGIPGDKQLDALIRDMESKLSDSYTSKIEKRDRKIAREMLRVIGDKQLQKDLRNMSSEEFNLLWSYTNFAEIASFDYEIAKRKLQDPKAIAQYNESFDVQIREMKRMVKDVKALDLVRQSKNLN